MSNKKMMIISLFLSVAIILSYVERMIPTPFLVAGAKLGLANIVTVMTLDLLDKKSALLILMLRILLVSLMFAGFSSFLYSITGGMLSFLGMLIMFTINLKSVSLVGISVIGSTLHSLGQVIVASVLFQNWVLLSYLPVLLLTALITGVFIGLLANHLTQRLRKARVV
jgi:heptaprenyl diphosphate synthase